MNNRPAKNVTGKLKNLTKNEKIEKNALENEKSFDKTIDKSKKYVILSKHEK